MTQDEFDALQLGDVIRHKHASDAVVITGRSSKNWITTRTTIATNAHEWVLIQKSDVRLDAGAGWVVKFQRVNQGE